MAAACRWPGVLVAVFALALALATPIRADESAWKLADIAGVEHRPFESNKTRAIVLVFIMTDCPIANYYQPTLARLAKIYREQGVEFYLLHSDPDVTREAARKHARDFSITTPVVIDESQQIAKRVGATHAPQAFVIDRSGKTLYEGRIDNTYEDFGKKRPKPTNHDLQTALDSILADQPVANPKTQPIGCHIFFAE